MVVVVGFGEVWGFADLVFLKGRKVMDGWIDLG